MKQYILAITVCSFIFADACAGEQTQSGANKGQALMYDSGATEQLQTLLNTTNDPNYSACRLKFSELVNQGRANPNVKSETDCSLLSKAVMHDDYALAELLLAHRADPNISEEDSPLFWADQVPMAKLLLDNKADLQARDGLDEDLLNSALTHNRSAAMITFWCNAGLDANQPSPFGSLLHELFEEVFENKKTLMRKAAPFVWWQLDLSRKNNSDQTAVDVLLENSPELVPQFHALTRVVPQMRQEQQQALLRLLSIRLTKDPANLVVEYEPGIGYCDGDWSDVERRMLASVEAAKRAARKRARSKSLAIRKKKR